MATIARLAVLLTADTRQFEAKTLSASGKLAGLRASFNRATDSARAWKSLTGSVGGFRLAGRETLDSFRTTLAVARSELRRFGRNKDVQVAVEFGREMVDEAWLRARARLQRLASRTGITVAASVVAARSGSALAWINRQRRQLTKPITVRLMLARRGLDSTIAATRARLDSLRRYRAVRIVLAAVNATRLPAQAALASLAPLRRLAGTGIIIAIRAAHFGIAAAVTRTRRMLGGLAGLGSSIARSLVGGFALVGTALGFIAAYKFTGLVNSSMDSIDAVAKLSDRLGMTTESLAGLQHAAGLAGVENDALTGSLEKMLRNLSVAATKGGPAADSLRQMGLDAKTLAAGTPDAAFKAIADGLAGVENPAQRAQFAMDLFGKSGQQLLPLMLSGADGIAAAQAEAERLGLTFSRMDAAQVEAANDSITRMKGVITGVANQVAIGLSPYIDAAAKKFTAMATDGGGIGPKVGGAIEWVATAIATVADYLNLVRAGFKLLQAGATYAVFGVVKSIDVLGSKFVDLINLLPGVSVEWTSFTGQLADGLLEEARQLSAEAGKAFDSFSRGENADAVSRVFADIRASSAAAAQAVADGAPKISSALTDIEDEAEKLEKVSETLAELRKEASQFGLSESNKKLLDLEAMGASAEQIAEARDLLAGQDQLTKLTSISSDDPLTDFAAKMEQLQQLFAAGKVSAEQFAAIRDTAKTTLSDKLSEQAKSITEEVRSPLEAYQAEVEKLNTLLEQGLITQETFDRATVKAKGALASELDVQTAAPTLRAGSAEAQRFAFDQTPGVQRLSKDDISKKALAEAQESSRLLDRIERNTRSAGADLQTVDI